MVDRTPLNTHFAWSMLDQEFVSLQLYWACPHGSYLLEPKLVMRGAPLHLSLHIKNGRPGHKEPLVKTARGPPHEVHVHANCLLSGPGHAHTRSELLRRRCLGTAPDRQPKSIAEIVGCLLCAKTRRSTFRAAASSHLRQPALAQLELPALRNPPPPGLPRGRR